MRRPATDAVEPAARQADALGESVQLVQRFVADPVDAVSQDHGSFAQQDRRGRAWNRITATTSSGSQPPCNDIQ